MPRAKHAVTAREGKLAKRPKTPPPDARSHDTEVRARHYRPSNVDVPDVTLPKCYRRHGIYGSNLEIEELKRLKRTESGSDPSDTSSERSSRSWSKPGYSLRPSSEFPPRKGQSHYCGSKTSHFYLTSAKNLTTNVLASTFTNDNRNQYKKKSKGKCFFSRWIETRKKRKWVEPSRDDKEDLQLFGSVYELLDHNYRGGRVYYREESINTCVHHRIKFEHPWRMVTVLGRSLENSIKEMQYELEFEFASRGDKRFYELFQIIDSKYMNARVMFKKDKRGRRHVKVEHPICGFRACGLTTKEVVRFLTNLYEYEIGQRGDRRLNHWRSILEAIDLYYPNGKLFFKQIDVGTWDAIVLHEVEGEKASGSGDTLNGALEQVRYRLEDAVYRLQEGQKNVASWRC